jgi:hypothetical protein
MDILNMSFKQLEVEAPHNPKVQEYLSTFHESVKEALYDTNTPTSALPFRGSMNLNNLANLMRTMSDLYDYLKESFSNIESYGDVLINKILDAAKEGDYYKFIELNEDQCTSFVNNYIATTYYSSYLAGYKPIAFSIDEWYPPQEEYVPFPRKDYWWKEMRTMTWDQYYEKYPEKQEQY